MPTDPKATSQAAQVLAGDLRYDDVEPAAQHLVQDEWRARIAERRSNLDLKAKFRSRGRRWSECDESGHVVERC